MSQLDRAFIRAYTSETPSRTPSEAASTSDVPMNNSNPTQQATEAKIRTMTRKPTLSELQHWKNQGIRIDMPGSPLVGSFDETAATNGLTSPKTQDEFELASKNTAAVAEALDRLMNRVGGVASPKVQPVSAKKPLAEPASELPSPTIEIQNWEVESAPTSVDEEEGITFVATKTSTVKTAPENTIEETKSIEEESVEPIAESEPAVALATKPYRQRSLTHPKWEADTIAWPEETDMILDLCGTEWQAVVDGLSSNVKSLAVVALGEGCGCTTLTICLAKLLAAANRRVLIIDEGKGDDCLTVRIGLNEALPVDPQEKIETLYEAMIETADQPIAVLPAGYRKLTDLTANQLQQFTQDFDIVLWDGGNRPEVWQRLALVHSVLVVRDARGSHDHELGQILPKLEQRKINVIGIAENFWR
ncbi:hypothetical protein DTL21_08680 [Bremerella cremea]|uniref:CobQ/CobB/MinD/ParA nucleotide binding domain-containing protein n=1 Tax=Blastopirellula marina TaxID=124 RepID=A0A2S8FUY4_9BACT|nr:MULTISPECIES: hypothetical protein [Pirellulaceae]PQO35991.1 hypothetical protein C5Y83_08675 [Blastopirellula marina]RCS48668.1 hypothetical protein DTL21_08680 [Bremerella cremea]